MTVGLYVLSAFGGAALKEPSYVYIPPAPVLAGIVSLAGVSISEGANPMKAAGLALLHLVGCGFVLALSYYVFAVSTLPL